MLTTNFSERDLIRTVCSIRKAITAYGNARNTTDNTPASQGSTALPDNLKDADFSLRETVAVDFAALSEYGLPIIVDYGADTCIPCKEMAPMLEKANKDFQGKAFIKFVNVWDYPDAANNVPIQVIPTQVFISFFCCSIS